MQRGDPERADSKVLSDEEVEEAEASDSFPALGYPVGLGSIGSGKGILTLPSSMVGEEHILTGKLGQPRSQVQGAVPALAMRASCMQDPAGASRACNTCRRCTEARSVALCLLHVELLRGSLVQGTSPR